MKALVAGRVANIAVVLFTDIVKSVDLRTSLGEDEFGKLKDEHDRLFESLLQSVAPQGEQLFIKSTGDGFLKLFQTAADAVRFALAVQSDMERSNAGQPEDRQIWLRVGINTGQVFYDGKTAVGEVVNIAARLENLARPGQICVTAAVYEELGGQEEFGFGYLGPQYLKNIRKSADVFEVFRAHSARKLPERPAG